MSEENKGINWPTIITTTIFSIQSSSSTSKLFISFIICAASAALVWFVWQKPGRDPNSNNKEPDKVISSSESISSNTAGPISSIGQSGGVTAQIYNSYPPATEAQKHEKRIQLESEISELAEFPERQTGLVPATMFESLLTHKTSQQLYMILEKYFKVTIESAHNGNQLINFRSNYRDFLKAQKEAEENAMIFIGEKYDIKESYKWIQILKYYILRLNGNDINKSLSWGNFLRDYGVDQSKAEEIIQEMYKNELISARFSLSGVRITALSGSTNSILTSYKNYTPK